MIIEDNNRSYADIMLAASTKSYSMLSKRTVFSRIANEIPDSKIDGTVNDILSHSFTIEAKEPG